MVVFAAVGVMLAACGVGLWRGRRWAWYSVALGSLFSVAHGIGALATIVRVLNKLPVAVTGGAWYYLVPFWYTLVAPALIYLFLLHPRIAAHFGFDAAGVRAVALKQCGIVLAVMLLVKLVMILTV